LPLSQPVWGQVERQLTQDFHQIVYSGGRGVIPDGCQETGIGLMAWIAMESEL
jgi:hypothetical protein